MDEEMNTTEIRHFHLFCGLGGGARGFNRGAARVGTTSARFRCIGGIDVDPAAVRDFEKLSGVKGTLLDLFDREQYRAWHESEPPRDWREVTPDDIRRAAGNERPHIVFTSPPCKGFSGLLSETRSRSGKYQALNRLTLRGIWLTLEAWADDPPEFFILENVPRIMSRGRGLLDQIVALLQRYGYATAETTHDCGEIGGLAQTRKRFLLVARHRAKVPPFLYEPVKRPLRAVGDVLDHFPLPGAAAGGPMHRIPALQWKTWVRLAFVEAGKDWRSLNRLTVVDGALRDYLLVPEMHHGVLGVRRWDQTSHTVIGNARPLTGSYAVADPRYVGAEYGQYGVLDWDETSGTVTSQRSPGQGRFAVADPRAEAFGGAWGVKRWEDSSRTVAGQTLPSNGAFSVADPRPAGHERWRGGKYRVTRIDEASGAVIAASTTGNGAFAISDPRVSYGPNSHLNKFAIMKWDGRAKTITAGNQVQGGALSIADPRVCECRGGSYGCAKWKEPAHTVTGSARVDNGVAAVADPRLPGAAEQLVALIIAEDGTWHRPFTTLELAALQGLVDPEEHMELDGLSDSAWRERIGNAVPPPAAEAIASVMGRTLLLAWSGETFALDTTPIWVRQIAVALSCENGKVI
jgi:site-specific DNA-cytosine methylase